NGLAVLCQNHAAADETEPVERPARRAERVFSRGGVVSDGVEKADIPVFDPAADDFERGGGGVDRGDKRLAVQALAIEIRPENKRDLALDARLRDGAEGDFLPLVDRH